MNEEHRKDRKIEKLVIVLVFVIGIALIDTGMALVLNSDEH